MVAHSEWGMLDSVRSDSRHSRRTRSFSGGPPKVQTQNWYDKKPIRQNAHLFII